jgi:hypothetical protein
MIRRTTVECEMTKRRWFTAVIKAGVAPRAPRGDKTIQDIAPMFSTLDSRYTARR